MINNILNCCIIVIHPVIVLGVSFINIYHEYKIIYKYEEKLGGLARSIVWYPVQVQ